MKARAANTELLHIHAGTGGYHWIGFVGVFPVRRVNESSRRTVAQLMVQFRPAVKTALPGLKGRQSLARTLMIKACTCVARLVVRRGSRFPNCRFGLGLHP